MSAPGQLPFERVYPWVPWREPIKVTRTDGAEGWACRICIALFGLKGAEISELPATREAVLDHIARERA